MKYALQLTSTRNVSELARFQRLGRAAAALPGSGRAWYHWAVGSVCWETTQLQECFGVWLSCRYWRRFSFMTGIRSSIPRHPSGRTQKLLAWLPRGFSPVDKSISPVLPFWVSNFFVPPADQHSHRSKAFLLPPAPRYEGKTRVTKAEIFADLQEGSWLRSAAGSGDDQFWSCWYRGRCGLQGRVKGEGSEVCGTLTFFGSMMYLMRWQSNVLVSLVCTAL